mmetsp:Transcript_150781/g.482546  ORF Transcript_150781/g.482546 Transcript_150781/m.482546 type:complete len:335 (-) Transcript_150781:10-1014(-)
MPGSAGEDAVFSLWRCVASVAQRFCGGTPSSSQSVARASSAAAGTFRGKPLPYAGMTALTEADLECIDQRHLYRKPADFGAKRELGRQTVGAGGRCRHGWPQAIVYDPLYRERPDKSHRLGDTTRPGRAEEHPDFEACDRCSDVGLPRMRLTCPLLVTAIDKLEKGGAMERYNQRLLPGADWEGELQKVNEAHRLLRLELIGDRSAELAEVRQILGEQAFAIAMRTGLASLRPEARPDVKCLHAQVADELVRGGDNPIAKQVLRDIEDQGVLIHGSEECCDNCDVRVPLPLARWKLDRCKNNVGKRLSRGRKQAASRATSLAGDVGSERSDEDL